MLAGLAMGCQPSEANAVKQGMIKVAIMYPNETEAGFDMDYYKTSHMPMLAELFGETLVSYEIDSGLSGRTADEQAMYVAIGYLYFNQLSDYQNGFQEYGEQILSDIPNYTTIRPIVQISKVVK